MIRAAAALFLVTLAAAALFDAFMAGRIVGFEAGLGHAARACQAQAGPGERR